MWPYHGALIAYFFLKKNLQNLENNLFPELNACGMCLRRKLLFALVLKSTRLTTSQICLSQYKEYYFTWSEEDIHDPGIDFATIPLVISYFGCVHNLIFFCWIYDKFDKRTTIMSKSLLQACIMWTGFSPVQWKTPTSIHAWLHFIS